MQKKKSVQDEVIVGPKMEVEVRSITLTHSQTEIKRKDKDLRGSEKRNSPRSTSSNQS